MADDDQQQHIISLLKANRKIEAGDIDAVACAWERRSPLRLMTHFAKEYLCLSVDYTFES